MSLSRSLQYAFIAIVTLSVGFSLYQWNASRASTAKTAPNNGLVGYWSFNEGTGTLAGDASVNKNTGTLTNGPTWVSGKLGQALNFDGVNDYVNVPSPVITAYPATITAWVKVPAGATTGFPITITDSGDYSAWGISASPTQIRGFTSASYQGADSYLPLSVDATQWTFVSFVLTNATSRTLYVNNLTPVTDTTNRTPISLDVLNIGRIGGFWASHGFDNWFTGQVDEVRIYNRALSGTEITNLYNLGAAKLNTSPTASLTSGLVGYWTFDGKDTPWSSSSAGTATDRSGSGNTGTLTNMSRATSSVSGKLGQALNFDGSNDYISYGNLFNFSGTASYTISAWVNPNSANGMIMSKHNTGITGQWRFRIESGALATLREVSPWILSGGSVPIGQWSHVLCSYNGSTLSLYVNGVLVAGPSSFGSVASNSENVLIGADYTSGSPSNFFNGSIDEVRIYNRALSSTEVQSLYDLGASDKVNSSVSQNQGTGRLDSGLVGYWKLDDGSGTTATDSSVNGNNGTLTNGPTWGTGRIGGDVVFDGSNDYIDLGNRSVLNLVDNFSISIWVSINNLTQANYKRFFGGDDINGSNRPVYMEYDYTANQYRVVWQNGGTYASASGKTLTAVQWQHFVITFKGGTLKSYSDGALISSSSGRVSPPSNAVSSYIGGTAGGGVFPGSIDEVRVYNRALSDDEVSQLYRLTTPTGVDTSLKGYWSFDGPATNWTSSSAGTVSDLSGNGNTGTMTNMSRATSSVSGKLGQALYFDGVDDYVNVSGLTSDTIFTGASNVTFSAAAWFRSTVASGIIVSKGQDVSPNSGGWAINFSGSAINCPYKLNDGTNNLARITARTGLNDGVWHHVVCIFTTNTTSSTGQNADVYIDGVLDNSTLTNIGPVSTNSNSLAIGRRINSVSPTFFTGKIDDVRIYNRALSAPEISALYNSGR